MLRSMFFIRLLAYMLSFMLVLLFESFWGFLIGIVLIILGEFLWQYVKVVKEVIPNKEREERVLMKSSRSTIITFLVVTGAIIIAKALATHLGIITIEENVKRIIHGYSLATLLILIIYSTWTIYYSLRDRINNNNSQFR